MKAIILATAMLGMFGASTAAAIEPANPVKIENVYWRRGYGYGYGGYGYRPYRAYYRPYRAYYGYRPYYGGYGGYGGGWGGGPYGGGVYSGFGMY